MHLVDNPTPNLKAVSLFSGGGGLDLGIEAVGFSTLLATDIDRPSCITLENGGKEAEARNRPFLTHSKVINAPVQNLDAKSILNVIDCKSGELSLLIGGPPCQAFSVFGKRQGRQDPRGQLVFEYLRLLSGLRPEAFVFENVYGFLTVENGAIYKDVAEKLSNPANGLYYELSLHRLDAVNYGVPQFRDRVFIIGHRKGKKVTQIPPITSGPKDLLGGLPVWRTVRDALRDLPEAETSYPYNHTGRTHSDRIIDRYSKLTPGERDSRTRINKLDLDRPSFTIIVGSDKGGGKGHVHPILPREVTPRESARIQTFPDWWAFAGNRTRDPIRQIGNAVPPLLAAAVGNAIRTQIFELPSIDFRDTVRLLDQEHLFSEHDFWQTDLQEDTIYMFR